MRCMVLGPGPIIFWGRCSKQRLQTATSHGPIVFAPEGFPLIAVPL
jgi:hypothetical protein